MKTTADTGTEEKTPKKKALIDTWVQDSDSNYVGRDGKHFVVYFNKLFSLDDFASNEVVDDYKELIKANDEGEEDNEMYILEQKRRQQQKLARYNQFLISKTSYENQLDNIIRYVNFFIHFYDTEQELIAAYLKLKLAIDRDRVDDTTGEGEGEKLYGANDKEAFISLLYDVMFTPSMVEKIKRMVEENYTDDIEAGPEEKKRYYKANEKRHLESLEFTNQHVKILHAISFGMKILCPVMFHFCTINSIKIDKTNLVIYDFYKPLFDLFNDGCNMFNKLYVYVKTKVLESDANNKLIFEQREIFGIDVFTVITQFTKVVLISENMVKYNINENIIGFNKTIIKYQLTYFIKEQYDKNLTEVTWAKNSEGLSGIDKMAMNLEKLDEGAIVFTDVNIANTIERIRSKVDIDIDESEIEYYMEHLRITDLQKEYLYSFYAKYFETYKDLKLLTKRQYIYLLIMMKKVLLIDLGYDVETGGAKAAAIPYILSGNIEDRIVNRMIRNGKFIDKLESSYKYQRMVSSDYALLAEIPGKGDFIKSKLSAIINTKFTYVTPEEPELTGTEITYDEEEIADELLDFLIYI